MDKQTLSNYGWIVICILVLSVMIAFATPFGSFIASGVKSTTQGLFDVNQKAFNNVGFGQIPDQEFEGHYNGAPAMKIKEGYLSGTWKFNDVLNLPNSDMEHSVIGYWLDDADYYLMYGGGFPLRANQYYMEMSNRGPSYDADSGWGVYDSDEYKTIVFTEEQQTDMDFWNWFTANAKRIA